MGRIKDQGRSVGSPTPTHDRIPKNRQVAASGRDILGYGLGPASASPYTSPITHKSSKVGPAALARRRRLTLRRLRRAMLAWLQACINWLCKQWAWLFAKRVRLNNSSVDVGPVLAEGGFATVYEAVDVRTKRSIAIKQIRCPDADHAARADAEIEAHGKLRHATIAELLDYGIERNVYRLAFPLYGASVRKLLDDALATRTCLTPQMAASILVAVGEALAECHACQLMHGDLKPDNVLQCNSSWVLVDLGSCSGFGAPLQDRRDCLALQDFAAEHSTLTYRAPELWQPQIGDARRGAADIFALGALCWALAFGYSPFESELRARGPVIVESSHSRALSAPAPPPRSSICLRRYPGFYSPLIEVARRLFVAEASSRPDAREALELLRGLAAGGEAV